MSGDLTRWAFPYHEYVGRVLSSLMIEGMRKTRSCSLFELRLVTVREMLLT
jgi:hypothetical protein